MTLPNSRNKTYTLGDPPRSADLNDLQDFIVAHDGLTRGDFRCQVPIGSGGAAYGYQQPTGQIAGDAISFNGISEHAIWQFPIAADRIRIKSVTVTVSKISGSALAYLLNGNGATVASGSFPDASGDHTIDLTGLAGGGLTIASGEAGHDHGDGPDLKINTAASGTQSWLVTRITYLFDLVSA